MVLGVILAISSNSKIAIAYGSNTQKMAIPNFRLRNAKLAQGPERIPAAIGTYGIVCSANELKK
ncbi:hypothetical protein GCM10007868_13930 [Gluconobacter frateurii]|uniref:Uncharacterized protein n=1 Tax=Gluconobacter frateurii NRIC 0228 TaxID=1307946 RepID=A0ABQ0QE46_9PROT|nr:hypothetical protein AA0228_2522 [Gluconobacter frateurii NRIC 0228]GLP90318.1 hypothetical protein GCM10007868_13930 [Gluconobacter frateurii]